MNLQEDLNKGVSDMYRGWFLDYASYVILERAVPSLLDGLKPVQRRILHAMFEVEDGRYNKVANIVGRTMQYHPHGDASIGDSLVQLGQKNLLIDTQGNWGNVHTGDGAAAPRYIEARLTSFAKEVLFNPKTTEWQLSYDGRLKEPLHLPAKFNLLLYHGAEGIAVGLSTKVMPHNFNEIIDASVKYLQGKDFQVFPDFATGGIVDISNYKDGQKGGRIRLRATISQTDRNTLSITDLPYGKNTNTLIDSILKASDKGRINIKKIEDNTSDRVEVLIHLQSRANADTTIKALYKFTDCEVSISPQACVIEEDKPRFLSISDILIRSVDHTVSLLKKELEIRRDEVENSIFSISLERIFITHKIYQRIEQENTWEGVLKVIALGLKPYLGELNRQVKTDDIEKLTQIPIKRISRFDRDKSDQNLLTLQDELSQIFGKLNNLTQYAIDYFRRIKKKYGKDYPRKTLIRAFEDIDASEVALPNLKLRADKEEGFVGTGLKKGTYLFDCSSEDYLLVVKQDGSYIVTKVAEKAFLGKGIFHVSLVKSDLPNSIFNIVYRDGRGGKIYAKRVCISQIKKEYLYHFTKGTEGSQILYLSQVEAHVCETVLLKIKAFTKKKAYLEVDFSTLPIRSKSVIGKAVTSLEVETVTLKKTASESHTRARELYYDETKSKLNFLGEGRSLGIFKVGEKILIVLKNGLIKCLDPVASDNMSGSILFLRKFIPDHPVIILYKKNKEYFLKKVILPDKEGVYNIDEEEIAILKITTNPKTKLKYTYSNGLKPLTVDILSKFEARTLRSKPYAIPSKNVKAVELEEV